MHHLVRGLACLAALNLASTGLAQCFEPSLGTNLNLGDDQVAQNQPLGFVFPGPAGNVSAVSISSNGFLWFSNNGDSGCCNGDPQMFLQSGPRLAAAWTDLDPSSGGAVYFHAFAASGSAPARAVVTWQDVPEYGSSATMTAQVQLFADGHFTMSWGLNASIVLHSVLVGITRGGGAIANVVDLSTIVGSTVHDSGSNPTVYDLQVSGFDLGGHSLEFQRNATGGYRVSEQRLCSNASFTTFGRGCPSTPTVYELFAAGTIDVGNRSFRFAPNGQGGWQITGGGQPLDRSVQHVVCDRDDQLAVGVPLPFTFQHPGGSTNQIDVSSNGCVYLQSGRIADARCCDGSVARFLAEAPSIAVLWQDLFPPGGGAVFFDADPAGQWARVTWLDCPEYGNSAVLCSAQLLLEAGGAFELRYGTVGNSQHSCLIGYTGGNGVGDPGPIDLGSAVPFSTGAGGVPLTLDAAPNSRPAIGSSFALQLSWLPANTQLGLLVLGLSRRQPSLELSAAGMPGCFLHVSQDVVSSFAVPGATVQVPLPIPNAPNLIGVSLFAQAAAYAPGVNAAGLLTSNGGAIDIGI